MSRNSVVNRFVITKGLDNSFVFTVKADGTTLPIEIAPADTFKAYLRDLDSGSVVLEKEMVVKDALSGKVGLDITAEETGYLYGSYGASEDRYYSKPVYSLVLECNTEANGNFLAKVRHVYVD